MEASGFFARRRITVISQEFYTVKFLSRNKKYKEVFFIPLLLNVCNRRSSMKVYNLMFGKFKKSIFALNIAFSPGSRAFAGVFLEDI